MTEDEVPNPLIGIEGLPPEHREELQRYIGEWATERDLSLNFVGAVKAPPTPVDIEAGAIDEIAKHYMPEREEAIQASEASEILANEAIQQKQDEREKASRDLDFLVSFVNMLPAVRDAVSELSITQYDNNDIRNDYAVPNPDNKTFSMYKAKVAASKFIGVDNLDAATQLNANTVWGQHLTVGYNPTQPDRVKEDNPLDMPWFGLRDQYKGVLTPAFMLGSRFVNDSAVEVLFVSPSHSANVDGIVEQEANREGVPDDEKVTHVPEGDYESARGYVYTITMTKGSFRDLTKEMARRQNAELSPAEQQEVVQQKVWPVPGSIPIMIRRELGRFTPVYGDKGIPRDEAVIIKDVHGAFNDHDTLTSDRLIEKGGLDVFDIDRALTELAIAFDKTEELKTLQRDRYGAEEEAIVT